MEKEVWKDIKHYEGLYKISSLGRVWSVHKHDFKVPHIKDNGYMFVQLYKNGKMRNEHLHRLVSLTFVPNPNNLPQVNHKDENKRNNCVDNLEWCDGKYNNNYGTAQERKVTANRKNGCYERAKQRWVENNPSKVNPQNRRS